jgi:DNA (cytosine-5)-methyltransferase 1
MLENVEEFQEWGPLIRVQNERTGASEWVRDPQRKGETFRWFVRRLEKAGYRVEWKLLRASHYGAPTIRRRLFLIARCDEKPIVWPEPTHGVAMNARLKPQRTAAECIDWSIPCPSIFLTTEEGRALGVKRPLVTATERRIARGIFKFVINHPSPFIVRVAHGEQSAGGVKRWGAGVHGVDEPLGTVPGSGEFAVAVPHVTKFRQGSIGSALDEPLPTVTAGGASARPGTGNAMGVVEATVAPFLTEHANATGDRVFSADEPLRTQCAQVKGGHFAMVAPVMHPVTHEGDARVYGPEEPFRTLTGAHGGEIALTAATLVQTGYGERDGQAPRVPGLDKPLGTVVAEGVKHAAVTAFLAKHFGGNETPGSSLADPVSTVTATDHNALVTAHIIGAGGPAYGGKPRPIDEPFGSQTAENHSAVVAANLVRHFGQSIGAEAGEPVGTICAGGAGKTSVCVSHLSKLYGTTTGQDVREPLHTVTGGGNHIAEVRAFLMKYYSEGGQDQDLREPLHTIPTHDRIALVVIEGQDVADHRYRDADA